MNLPCIVIPILVGLICAILGYLLGKLASSNTGELTALRTELDNCKARFSSLSSELDALKLKLKTNTSSGFVSMIPFNSDLFLSVFGRKINDNDLKIVEGIGPKIEELFQSKGIHTWKALSETTVERCKAILDEGGERYIVHDPGTWPQQAKLAYEGKWKELKDWQDQLDAGKH